jgi:hypothetical protein
LAGASHAETFQGCHQARHPRLETRLAGVLRDKSASVPHDDGRFALCGEGLCVGRDGGDAVSSEYKPQFPFSGSRVIKGVYDLADNQYVGIEKKFAEKIARD